jgi:hypothetical protein
MGEVDTKGGRVAPTGTSMRDMESALNWLKKRGIGVDTPPRKDISQSGETPQREISTAPLMDSSRTSNRPPGASYGDMSTAVKWLMEKGVPVESDKQNDPSGMPSASDMEQALNLYKEKGVDQHHDRSVASRSSADSTDQSTGLNLYKEKGADQHGRSVVSKSSADSTDLSNPPSTKDMETALSWLGKREKSALRNTNEVSEDSSVHDTKKDPDAQNKGLEIPSNKDMENALSWLQFTEAKPRKGPPKDQKGKAVEHDDDSTEDSASSPKDHRRKGTYKEKGSKKSDHKKSRKKKDFSSQPSSAEMEKAHKWLQKTKKQSMPSRSTATETASAPSSEDMENTLKWLQRNDGKFSSTRKKPSNLYPVEKAISLTPLSRSKQTERKKDSMKDDPNFLSALRWLTCKKANRMEDIVYFRKLDSILPAKEGQSMEARAKEMVRAMKWVKQKGLELEDKRIEVEKSHSRSPAPQQSIRVDKPPISDRERNKSKSPGRKTSKSPALDTLMSPERRPPPKSPGRGESSKSPGRTTKSPSNIRRSVKTDLVSNSPKKEKVSSTKTSSIPKREKVSLPHKDKRVKFPSKAKKSQPVAMKVAGAHLSPEERDLKNAMIWLKDKNAEGVEDANYFKKLDSMLPQKPGQTHETRAREIVKALHWVRKTNGKKEEKPEKEHKQLDVQATPKKQEKEKIAKKWGKPGTSVATVMLDKDTENALKWLDGGKKDDAEDSIHFKKLDKMLPKKAGQTSEERAIKMVKALKFLRKKGLDDAASKGSDDKTEEVKKAAPKTDMENALAWLQGKGTGKDVEYLEDASYFKKLDTMLPKKASEADADRAKAMVKMLGWLRKKGLNLGTARK